MTGAVSRLLTTGRAGDANGAVRLPVPAGPGHRRGTACVRPSRTSHHSTNTHTLPLSLSALAIYRVCLSPIAHPNWKPPSRDSFSSHHRRPSKPPSAEFAPPSPQRLPLTCLHTASPNLNFPIPIFRCKPLSRSPVLFYVILLSIPCVFHLPCTAHTNIYTFCILCQPISIQNFCPLIYYTL